MTPQPGSPLVDRGLVVPGIDDRSADAAPDIGVVGSGTPLFADGFETGTTGAWRVTAP